MRDFLYVSERKVDRLAATLPPRVAQRLKELRFNAGPVGAGVVLADRRAETAVAAVIEVERAIYDEFRVRGYRRPRACRWRLVLRRYHGNGLWSPEQEHLFANGSGSLYCRDA